MKVLLRSFVGILSLFLLMSCSTKTRETFNHPDFEIGNQSFESGDSITITEIVSRDVDFAVGGVYWVRGTYELQSHDRATIGFWVTSNAENAAAKVGLPRQQVTVEKGTGTFEVQNILRVEGYPHLSFYPVGGGASFGGVYFGADEWLQKAVP